MRRLSGEKSEVRRVAREREVSKGGGGGEKQEARGERREVRGTSVRTNHRPVQGERREK